MIRTAAVVALLSTLAGCEKPEPSVEDIDGLTRELAAAQTGNIRDPAVAAALAAPIMVDPGLAQSANTHVIRPPPHPASGKLPIAPLPADPLPALRMPVAAKDCPDCAARRGTLTIGALAQRQRDPRTARCATRIGYSAMWAIRLPNGFSLHPAARVIEAAGCDTPGCTLRIVSFATSAPPAKAIAFYHARAGEAGFTGKVQANGSTQIVAGTKGDAAYVVYAAPRAGGGTTVDLIVNGG